MVPCEHLTIRIIIVINPASVVEWYPVAALLSSSAPGVRCIVLQGWSRYYTNFDLESETLLTSMRYDVVTQLVTQLFA
jgi:hypothetical protein